jgi:hypothetical protein
METSDVFPTGQYDGIALLSMLKGEVGYRHGDQLFDLKPGEGLSIDTDAPHGPAVLTKLPARNLSAIRPPQSR